MSQISVSTCAVMALVLTGSVAIPLVSTAQNSMQGTAAFQLRRRYPHAQRSGTLEVARTYRKYNIPLPDDLAATVLKLEAGLRERDTGSARAYSTQYDAQYVVEVDIGTPPQTMYLAFDTGSSDMWVFSDQLPPSQVFGQDQYSPDASSTSKLLAGQSFDVRYGDGSGATGVVYADVVSIGGLVVPDQAVEVTTTVSQKLSYDVYSDGLLGLGFDSINTVYPTQQKTFMSNVLGGLDLPVFTVDLKWDDTDKNSTYNFGYIDDSLHSVPVAYVDVDDTRGYWAWTSSGYAIGNDSFSATPIEGIADTGTSILYLPPDIVMTYYKRVTGAQINSGIGGYTFPCSTTLPDFTFGIANSTITIPGLFIKFAPIETFSTTCFGSIQSDASIGFSIFGDTAFMSAFAVFDVGNKRLGWARKNL